MSDNELHIQHESKEQYVYYVHREDQIRENLPQRYIGMLTLCGQFVIHSRVLLPECATDHRRFVDQPTCMECILVNFQNMAESFEPSNPLTSLISSVRSKFSKFQI